MKLLNGLILIYRKYMIWPSSIWYSMYCPN